MVIPWNDDDNINEVTEMRLVTRRLDADFAVRGERVAVWSQQEMQMERITVHTDRREIDRGVINDLWRIPKHKQRSRNAVEEEASGGLQHSHCCVK